MFDKKLQVFMIFH